ALPDRERAGGARHGPRPADHRLRRGAPAGRRAVTPARLGAGRFHPAGRAARAHVGGSLRIRSISPARRPRGLRLMLGAGLISLTGDWVLRIGLAYYIYAITGSTLASATMLLASFVPQIALGSLAGVFVDRWDSKRTMIVANLLLAAGLLPL